MAVLWGGFLGAVCGYWLWLRARIRPRSRPPWAVLPPAAILDHVEAMLAETGAITSVRGYDGCDLWALVGDLWGAVWVVTDPAWQWDQAVAGWDREYPTWRRGQHPGATAPPSWGLVVVLTATPLPPRPDWARGVLVWDVRTVAGLWPDAAARLAKGVTLQ